MTNETPPTLTADQGRPASTGRARSTYPAPGTTIDRAWSAAWAMFREAPGDGYLTSTEVAQAAAADAGIEATTVQNIIIRFARDGILERGEPRTVAGKRGPRKHATFRIKR